MNQYLSVAEKLLESERRSMTAKEIAELAASHGMFSDKLVGKTPHQTIKSELSRHIRRYGDCSTFIRTKAGHFFLRRLLSDPNGIYNAPVFQPPPSKENVLVFPSTWLDNHNRFQGINTSWRRFAKSLLTPSVCSYMDRLEAEQDDSHKQVLTYVLVTRGNEVLAFNRGKYNRVEDWLRGSSCIGFGGHVIFSDRNIFDRENMGVLRCAAREVNEELKLPLLDANRLNLLDGLQIRGVLNDDSSAVGRRHFAFVLSYEVGDSLAWEKPRRGEKSITQLHWLNPASASLSLWDFEYWSQLCLRTFFPDLVRTQPRFFIRRREPLRPPHLLCVLGQLGSGKSETTKVLKEDFGYIEINSGRVIAELLGVPPIPQTPRAVFQNLAWEFINGPDGPRRLAIAIWEKIEENWRQLGVDKFPRVLIDGVRQKATLEELRKLTGRRRLGVLYVHTPPDIAFDFYRAREESNLTIHDFLQLRESPVEEEVREMIGQSDAVLYNWTGRSEYRHTIQHLINSIDETTR